MNLLMLSGNSLDNQAWIYDAEAKLKGLFEKTYIQDYQHWHSGGEWINLEHERPMLSEAVQKLGGDYGIFAKSIGTVLCVQGLEQALIKPKFLLFLGIPLGYIQGQYSQFAEVLARSELPVTVIHNTDDPVGTSAAVKDYLNPHLTKLRQYRFLEVPGNTHDYQDYGLLEAELRQLQNKP